MLIERFAVSGAAVGFDFHFGKGRAGSPAYLRGGGRAARLRRRCGAGIDAMAAGRCPRGRSARRWWRGSLDEAAELLGYPWFITGAVVHGDKRGRELGYPTANIGSTRVAACATASMRCGLTVAAPAYDGVANFGRRPMFDTGGVLLEVFCSIFPAIFTAAPSTWR